MCTHPIVILGLELNTYISIILEVFQLSKYRVDTSSNIPINGIQECHAHNREHFSFPKKTSR